MAEVDTGNTGWVLMSSALVMLMTPGLGFFHAGITGSKNTTNTLLMSMMTMALVTVQWVLVGYSFSFGKGNGWLGHFDWAALRNMGTDVSSVYGAKVPQLAFVAFQNMFAQITPALISGAVLGRMNFMAYVLFVFIWSIGIYNPVAHWVWSLYPASVGWLHKLGNVDFAGGDVIHIASGFSGLVVSLMLGKVNKKDHQPNNLMLVLGTSMLWFGWFGFNAGSQLAADGIAALAFINTHISACVGLLSWTIIEYFATKTVTASGVASGVIAGLVTITPACGYVEPMMAFLFGFVGTFASWFTLSITKNLPYDLEAFALHGVAGVVGSFLTGLFANKDWNNLVDGTVYGGDKQILYQLVGIGTIAGFAAAGSFIIITVLKYTIGIKMTKEQQFLGADKSFHGGNNAYFYDESSYTNVVPGVVPNTPPNSLAEIHQETSVELTEVEVSSR
jgi:ammonium transporter, Amt family